MGWRFYRRFKIIPGVHVNVSKKGTSVSVGGPGAQTTIGPRGTRTTFGIPGTGISYTDYTPRSDASSTRQDLPTRGRDGSSSDTLPAPENSPVFYLVLVVSIVAILLLLRFAFWR
jgi:hypothetical protein